MLFHVGGNGSSIDRFECGFQCGRVHQILLPNEGSYDVEVIDIWEMARKKVLSNVNGRISDDASD